MHGCIIESLFFAYCFFFGLGIAWMWAFASFNSAPISFHPWFMSWLVLLPCHCIVLAMTLFNFRLLGFFWACHVLFLPLVYVTEYFCQISSHVILGFLGPFHSFGYLWPVSFLGASLAHLILSYFLYSNRLLLNLLGFSGPITISFTFGFIGLWTNPIY